MCRTGSLSFLAWSFGLQISAQKQSKSLRRSRSCAKTARISALNSSNRQVDADRFAVVGQEGGQIGCIAHDPVLHAVMEPVDDLAGALFEIQLQEVWFEH